MTSLSKSADTINEDLTFFLCEYTPLSVNQYNGAKCVNNHQQKPTGSLTVKPGGAGIKRKVIYKVTLVAVVVSLN